MILLAGLTAIPQDVKDAANVDGAGFFRQLFAIRIPLLLPIMAVAVLYGIVFTFTDMIVVYILTRGGPFDKRRCWRAGPTSRGSKGEPGPGRGDRAVPLPGAGRRGGADAANREAGGNGVSETASTGETARRQERPVGATPASPAAHPAAAPAPSGTMRRTSGSGGRRGWRRGDARVLYVTATFFALFAALPFAWMILTVFKQNTDLYNPNRNPFLYNDPPTLGNITYLFERTEYATFARNTLIVAVLVVLITLIGAVPAAYSLSRLAGKWGEGLGIAIFLVYLVPPTLLFIPLSRVVADLGLRNTWWAMVLVYPTFTIPFCTWLLMGFFKSIPRDIEEQAMIDGYSRLGAIWRTVLPVSLPGLLTVVVFSFALTMHEFVYALAFVTSSHQKTISIGVTTELIRGDVFFWQSLMAAAAPSSPSRSRSSTTSSWTASSPASRWGR